MIYEKIFFFNIFGFKRKLLENSGGLVDKGAGLITRLTVQILQR